MKTRHDTPAKVAKILARYAPKGAKSVLDPSAGSGVLAREFLNRSSVKRIECIDIDINAIESLSRLFVQNKYVKVIGNDFLVWSSSDVNSASKRFDCIIMNPPFAARKNSLVPIETPEGKLIHTPIEAAFVLRAAKLLKTNGRILAILPASIISGKSTSWLRTYLLESGAIRLVHELPPRTFSGVEGRMYMLVYAKGRKQRQLLFCNHRLIQPDKMSVSIKELSDCKRLDFAFYAARLWAQKVAHAYRGTWVSIGEIATIYRGAECSPVNTENVLHTTNLRNNHNLPSTRIFGQQEGFVQFGDIVMSRVGRGCAQSPTIYLGAGPIRCSDCILIVRPMSGLDAFQILFAMRILVSSPEGAGLIEQGVGATYVTMEKLSGLRIPIKISDEFPKHFKRYTIAVKRKHWRAVQESESEVRTLVSTSLNEKN